MVPTAAGEQAAVEVALRIAGSSAAVLSIDALLAAQSSKAPVLPGASAAGEDLAQVIRKALESSAAEWILIGPSALRVFSVHDLLRAAAAAARSTPRAQAVEGMRVLLVAPNWSASSVIRWLICAGSTPGGVPLGLSGFPVTTRLIASAANAAGLSQYLTSDAAPPLTAVLALWDDPLPPSAPASQLIASMESAAGAAPSTNYFIRAFDISPAPPVDDAYVGEPAREPFLSVIVRTQGRRPQMLLEALTSLAAQEDQDFEVLLMAHSDDGSLLQDISDTVAVLDDAFRRMVRVSHVPAGSRGNPLNEGLRAAAGAYVAFLDDDDLVTADWVQAFRAGAEARPGAVVRALTREQRITASGIGEYRTVGSLEATYPDHFSLGSHLLSNSTPICSFALPMSYVRATDVEFDEALPVLEDWDMLVQAANWCGVVDVPRTTSIYHRWESGESSRQIVERRSWITAAESVLTKVDAGPVILDAGSAREVAEAFGSFHRVEAYEEWEETVLEEQRRLQQEVATQFEEIGRLNVVIRDMAINRNLWTRFRYRAVPWLINRMPLKSPSRRRSGRNGDT